jgi:hypothetical protein
MSRHPAPLIELLTYGKAPSDTIREPEINGQGTFVLEPGEYLLYSGSHKVSMSVWNETAGFRSDKKQWETAARPETKADLHFTDRRFLVAWPRWKSDRTSGSLLERRLMSTLMERDQGRMMLGAHVRHQWILAVFVGKPEGNFSRRRKLRLSFQDGAREYTFVIYGIDPIDGEEIGRAFSGAVAKRRLVEHPDLTDEQRSSLSDLASGGHPVDVGWADQYRIPAGRKVGYVFQESVQ